MASKQDDEERKKKLSCYSSRGPGPATVMLPPTIGHVNHDKTRNQAPAYSLGLKLRSSLVGNSKTPGPTYLIPPGMTAKGPGGAPAFSLRARTKIFSGTSCGPGPAAYCPEVNVNRNKAPAYSLRARTKILEGAKVSPGPIYMLPTTIGPKIPDKPAAAECSLKSRAKPFKNMSGTAGFYDIGRPDVVKNRAGQASITGRHSQSAWTYAAGPATYNLQNTITKIRPTPPAYSISSRHSECAGVYFTKDDKSGDTNCGCDTKPTCSNGACCFAN